MKFYCDVITRSGLQLINTLIDTLFCKLCTFLTQQRRRRKANDGCKRKLVGTVDESSTGQEIRKSDATVHTLGKIRWPAPSKTGSYGSPADEIWARLEILKAC